MAQIRRCGGQDPPEFRTFSHAPPVKRMARWHLPPMLLCEGLGFGKGSSIGKWSSASERKKVLLGIGGGHYAPRHMDVILKDGVWVGHLLSGYSLPMEDPSQNKGKTGVDDIGGTWKQAIRVAFDATQAAFPGGEVLAHLDQKSFKGWQKNAITEFLRKQGIKVGKPSDFC